MELPVWFEIATFVGLTVLLLADLAIVARRPHEPSVKEATLWVSFYVAWRCSSACCLLAVTNGTFATEFYAGWLTEYSLSVDNLFVFVIIMAPLPGAPAAAAGSADGRDHHRAGPARDLHPARRRGHRAVHLGLLHLRRLPRLHGDQPRPAPRRGRRLRGERLHPADAQGPADHDRTTTARRSGSPRTARSSGRR